jgi:uncharacterized protein YjcR
MPKKATEKPVKKGRGPARHRNPKKDLAYALYMNTDMTQSAIAEKVGTSEQALSRWAIAEEWQMLRAAASSTSQKQVRSYLMQLDELNEAIKKRAVGERYAKPDESDTIAKITKAIETLDKKATLSDYVSVFEGFFSFLRMSGNLETAQEIEPLVHEFVSSKASELR